MYKRQGYGCGERFALLAGETIERSGLAFDNYPYQAKTYARQVILRESNVTERSLVTVCRLVNATRSDDNPNGFTIEGFTIVENMDISTVEPVSYTHLDVYKRQDKELDLLHKRFIVFEIDSIKDHPILFPVTTIIIMELFINKMRRLKGIRKMIRCV